MPVISQPPTIPADINQAQSQAQNQAQSGTFNTNANSDAESSSRATNTNNVSNSGSLTNVQVNNTSNIFRFLNGVEAPVSTLSMSAYSNGADSGLVATLSIPLGGRTARRSAKLQNLQIQQTQQTIALNTIEAEARLASICANIDRAGYDVQEGLLSSCKTILVKKAEVKPRDQQISELKKLLNIQRAELESMRAQLQHRQLVPKLREVKPNTYKIRG